MSGLPPSGCLMNSSGRLPTGPTGLLPFSPIWSVWTVFGRVPRWPRLIDISSAS